MPYISSQELIDYSGVDAAALRFDTDAALRLRLDSWIAQAEEMVVKYIGVDHPDTAVPLGVANAVLRVAANMVAQARIRQNTAILNIDEYSQRLVPDSVFSRSIKEDLDPYVAATAPSATAVRKGSIRTTSQFGPRKYLPLEASVEAVNLARPLSVEAMRETANVWDVPNE